MSHGPSFWEKNLGRNPYTDKDLLNNLSSTELENRIFEEYFSAKFQKFLSISHIILLLPETVGTRYFIPTYKVFFWRNDLSRNPINGLNVAEFFCKKKKEEKSCNNVILTF